MDKNQMKEHISQNPFSTWRQIHHPPLLKGKQIPNSPPLLRILLSARKQRGKKWGGLRGVLLNHSTCIVLVVALMCGCGYSTRSLISRDISSIHIPIFENNTFRRGIEFDLTKAVKNEVMSKTNLRIASKDYADTILSGTIKDFTEGIITHGFRDSIVEGQMTLFVDIKLVDRRTGRTLVDKKGIKQATEYIVRRGETLESATGEGIVGMAETIVNHLEQKW